MRDLAAQLIVSTLLALGLVAQASAQKPLADIKDEVDQSEKAAKVFGEVMTAPDRGIPEAILDSSECIAVFPNVIKAAFGIGGRGGRGVASCRTATGWSAPAYFNLGGGSFGFQIGVESTDVVMLFMTSDSLNSLLSNNLELGADASVAAGPVGRQAAAATDLKFNAQILSYSRTKGLFAGVALKGAVIKPAADDMRDVYGDGVTAREVLRGSQATPAAVAAFPRTLASHSTRKSTG